MDEATLRRLVSQMSEDEANTFMQEIQQMDQNANPELSMPKQKGLWTDQDTEKMNSNFGMFTSPDEMVNPLYQLNKLFSPLNGIDSLPDVAYNTDWKNPLDVMAAPLKYGGNILKGFAGWLPFVDAPEFKTAQDVMEKAGISTGNEWGDLGVGIAADIATSPSSYVGVGLAKNALMKLLGGGAKAAKGANKVKKAVTAGGKIISKTPQAAEKIAQKGIKKVLPQKGATNVLSEFLSKPRPRNQTGSVSMLGMKSGVKPMQGTKAYLLELLSKRQNGMLMPNQMTGSNIL